MGCCGRRRARQEPQNVSAPCKILEQGGAGLKLWPKNIGGKYKLLLKDPEADAFVAVQDYLYAHGCNGPVANMLKSNLSRVEGAINASPTTFTKKYPNGLSLVQLLRTADAVTRSGSSNVRVHPFAPR